MTSLFEKLYEDDEVFCKFVSKWVIYTIQDSLLNVMSLKKEMVKMSRKKGENVRRIT